MSFKKFSSDIGVPKKDGPDGKREDAPAGNQPAKQPDKTPVDAAPVSKP